MYRAFTSRNELRYIDILQKLIDSHNNTHHRSIGIRPSEVDVGNEAAIRAKLFPDELEGNNRNNRNNPNKRLTIHEIVAILNEELKKGAIDHAAPLLNAVFAKTGGEKFVVRPPYFSFPSIYNR